MNTNHLQDLDTTRAAIASEARALGCSASVEYPGYVRIMTINGRIAHVGTVNGPWQADIYRDVQACGQAFRSEACVAVPDSHNLTPEGIARYVVGTMAGIIEYRAYASESEAKKANQ